ncbi:hypothetical protein AB6A40_001920 [Gnathostoma spinigerum]|uniref:Terminal uridylyltransferase 4/7 nucleotidyltransferase domain-containing protein n=1 Tax=Gnathostoma spinigerum TaxID=75299 RepID=A0ABD6E7R5_9BILA
MSKWTLDTVFSVYRSPQYRTEVALYCSDRVEDLVIPSGLFKDFTVVFNNQGFYILDDRIEVVIDGTQGKDYIHLILFYCDPQDHKRKVRDGYRICAESILMNTVSTDDIRNALEELAQHLQHVWQGSFLPEKPPYDVSLYSLPYLARRSVHPLKKKSDRFVRAIYFCNLCYMHINSIDSARRHFEGYEHLCAEKRKAAINDLRSLPQPGVTYLTKLNSVLEEVVKSECLEDSVYVKVDEFTAFLTKILKSKVHEDCSLRLYGSFLTRVASASSNINYSLLYPPSFSRGQILGFVKRALETECSMLSEFATDYQRSDPSVHFKVEAGYVAKHPITVFISCHALSALKLSYVISVLGRLRSQLIPLICVFRSWAKLCKLHVVALGGIPLYGFDLMLIHYLQHCHLLPHVEIEQENEHEVQSDEPYSSYNKFVSSSDREKMSKRVHDLVWFSHSFRTMVHSFLIFPLFLQGPKVFYENVNAVYSLILSLAPKTWN